MSIPIRLDPLSILNNEPKYFTLKAIESGSTVKISKIGTPNTQSLYFRTKDIGWTPYTIDDVINLDKGDYVQFWNHRLYLSTSNDNLAYFTMTGKIEASGNIQSLLNFNEIAPKYCFRKLFQNCTSLVRAPKVLPASVVEEMAYGATFSKTSITNFPKILATTIGIRGCQYMFEACPITRVKNFSPSVVDTYACNYMFYNCTSLTEVNKIDIQTLNGSYNLYGMFAGCNNLIYGPKILIATILRKNCYEKMFAGCKKLLYAPILPAENLRAQCYNYMFQGCEQIRYFNVNFTQWLVSEDNNSRACQGWVSGVRNNSDVDFICPSSLDLTQIDENHILSDWNIVRK